MPDPPIDGAASTSSSSSPKNVWPVVGLVLALFVLAFIGIAAAVMSRRVFVWMGGKDVDGEKSLDDSMGAGAGGAKPTFAQDIRPPAYAQATCGEATAVKEPLPAYSVAVASLGARSPHRV